MTQPTLSSDQAAVVDKNYHWIPIDKDTPCGPWLQLINEHDGRAVYGCLDPKNRYQYTHWAPCPTFKRD